MKWLELRVPPPLVLLAAAVLMWLVARAFPAVDFTLQGHAALAVLFALVGILLGVTAALQFRRARTTINPMRPHESAALVMDGVYRRSRNPIYLGDAIVLAAWALWLANGAAFLVLPLFVVYLNRFQIAPEERALEARFGAVYVEYCQRARRWL